MVVRIMSGSARMSNDGKKVGTMKMLIMAPRAMSMHIEEIMSAWE